MAKKKRNMKNIFEQVTDLLKEDERLVSQDGVLLKNQTQELARKNDPALIKLLLSDKATKQHFFFEVGKTLIFDKEKFIRFVSNKQFLPDSYTAFKNKIGLTAGDEYLSESKEVVLAWPYKDCVLEGGMTKEDQKRDEIFYNETLAPDDINRLLDAKVFTNFKRIDKKGEHKLDGFNRDEKGAIKDNLIIKGNNLLALASLKKEFAGKVKLIYIDPPYNTEGDADTFTYNNSFKHSTWLTFIKNRLELAKEMLKEDGFVALTIDHFELFYLGALADEVFGRDNRLGVVSVVIRPQGRQFSKFFSATTEYMLVYAKNEKSAKFNGVILDDDKKLEYTETDDKGSFKYEPLMYSRFVEEKLKKGDKYFYPIFVSKDLEKITLEKKSGYLEILPINKRRKIAWRIQKNKFRDILLERPEDFRAIRDKSGAVQIFEKYREEDGTKIKTHWIGKRYNATTSGTGVLKEIFGEKVFSYPKALYAVLDTIKITTNPGDIILDFFAGSGTTGHAVLELNKDIKGKERKFILVEQMDYAETVIAPRLKKVLARDDSDSSFIYIEFAKWNEEWIEKIEKAKTSKELAKLWDEMKETAFLSYKVDPKTIDANVKDFADLSIADQKKFLIECLDKNQLYVNLSEIEDKEYGVSKEDKALNKGFYK